MLICPCNFPGTNTGVGSHFLLHKIFLTQGSNSVLLHWQVDSLLLSHQAFPIDRYKRVFIIRISSGGYGKLEKQGLRHNSVQVQRPENKKNQCRKSQRTKTWEPGALISESKGNKWCAQENWTKICPCSDVFALFGPSVDWRMPSEIEEGVTSLLSLLQISMLISSRNTLTDTSRNNVLLTI